MEKSFNKEETTVKVATFLEKNYPCKCGDNDPDCPGEYYEAQAIVEMIMDDLKNS